MTSFPFPNIKGLSNAVCEHWHQRSLTGTREDCSSLGGMENQDGLPS